MPEPDDDYELTPEEVGELMRMAVDAAKVLVEIANNPEVSPSDRRLARVMLRRTLAELKQKKREEGQQ